MSSQWLIFLTLISLLYLLTPTSVVARSIVAPTDDEVAVDNNEDVGSNNGRVPTKNVQITSNDDDDDTNVVSNHVHATSDDDDVTSNNVDVPSYSHSGSCQIDTSYYYRLTNNYSGRTLALDVINDGSHYGIKMAPISRNTGQFWRFVHLGNRVYKLQTRFLKNQYSLDIVNDGVNNKPHMARTGDYSGQRWHLVCLNDGTFKLTNEFSGNTMALDVYANSHIGQMSNINNNYSGQHWKFTTIGKIVNYN